MKIQIITTCTGEKLYKLDSQLSLEDFREKASDERAYLAKVDTLSDYSTSAEELYTGQQHIRLISGVAGFREKFGAHSVDLKILSAGYGLLSADDPIVPYDATFQGMKAGELREWSDQLGIHRAVTGALSKPFDLTLVLLGDPYLRAIDLDGSVKFGSPTLFFASKNSQRLIHGIGQYRSIPLSNSDAKRFSCALIGLKGELAKRLLKLLGEKGTELIAALFDSSVDILSLLDEVEPKQIKKNRSPIANPNVDQVIHIPTEWWNKPHRAELRYFIPEWDDLVDPDYDFETDTHSGGGGDWSNETYAHQMYPEPNYDGILISKVVAEKSVKKKERINRLGVHRFLRVPREFPIMGDCGAFGYIMDETPPYTTDEILDYYTRLDFDYGVSIDHLIVKATTEQKQIRYDLTIQNAEDFLVEHMKRGLSWTPIGAVQGWDPASYADAARQYVAMGYKYIGIGGLVRSSTAEVLRILDEVHKVVPEHVDVHLFGLARPKALRECARLGVRSVDSASYLRQAWMRGAQGYLLDEGPYASIRIPESGKSFRAKRMAEIAGLDEAVLLRMENAALTTIRALAKNNCSVETCLDALLEYDRYITSERVDMSELYRKTLEERPWEKCGCEICRKDGVEVVIFRGNNRNRRRGFHNTYVFFRLLQRILLGENVGFGGLDEGTGEPQMPLFTATGVSV